MAEKPIITDDTSGLDKLLLEELLSQMSTLASVYHKPANTFINQTRLAVQKAGNLETPPAIGSPRASLDVGSLGIQHLYSSEPQLIVSGLNPMHV